MGFNIKNFSLEDTYDSVILILGIYSREMKPCAHKKYIFIVLTTDFIRKKHEFLKKLRLQF